MSGTRDGLGDLEMTPTPSSSTRSSKKYKATEEAVSKAFGTNGWKNVAIILSVLIGSFFSAYLMNTARGVDVGSNNSIAVTIGAITTALFFGFGFFFIRLQLDPIHTILNIVFFDEPIGRGCVIIVIQFLGRLLGSLVAHGQVGYVRFEDAAVIPDGGYTTFQVFLVEFMLGLIIYIMHVGFSAISKENEVSLPTASILIGVATYFGQAITYPISGASLNVFHWLCTNIAGSIGDSTQFWDNSWYVYPLAPLAAAFTVGVWFVVMKYLVARASTPYKSA